MSITELKSQLGSYAKDMKLNLGSVLSEEGAPELAQNQIDTIALACAYAIGNAQLVTAIRSEVQDRISEEEVHAAKAAATIMGMNNVYYRFVHLVSDADYGKMPASLRMMVVGRPGVEKIDFELYSLAISAINGCGMCMDAHANQLAQHGVSKIAIQSAIRIAAVLCGTAQALTIEQ